VSEQKIPSATQRLAISKNDMASEVGRKLVKVLSQVLADGEVTENEVLALRKWLEGASKLSNIPGINFLREEIESVLADGKIDELEAELLVNSILRVLPTSERQPLKDAVSQAKSKQRDAKRGEQERIRSMPTERQTGFIQSLGGKLDSNATRQEASDLIDQLLQNRPTVRQQMVLRFWDELGRGNTGVEGVSRWMDSFYLEEPDRLLAWMEWKKESADAYSRDYASVESVPLGAGNKYLARIKASKAGRAGKSTTNSVLPRVLFWSVSFLIVAVLVAILFWFASRN